MRKIFELLQNNKNAFIWLILSNIAAVFNYLFQFLNRFHLSDAEFADLGSLANIQLIFTSFLLIPFVATATEFVKRKKDEKLNELFTATFIVSTVAGVIISVSALFSEQIFNIEDQWSVLFVGLSIVLLGTPVVMMGILMGMDRFITVGYLRIVEPTIKVVTSTLALIFGLTLFYIFLGALFASVAALAGFVIVLKKYNRLPKLDFKGVLQTLKNALYGARYSIMYLFGITLFYTLDVILINIVAPKELSGTYATLSLVGKIIFFGTMPLTQVFFNRFLERGNRGDLVQGNLFVISIVLIPLAVLLVYPDIVNLLFRTDTPIPLNEVRLFSLGAAMLTVAYLNGHFLVAKQKILGSLFIVLALTVFVVWITVSNSTLNDLTWAYMVANSILFFGLIAVAFGSSNQSIPDTHQHQ